MVEEMWSNAVKIMARNRESQCSGQSPEVLLWTQWDLAANQQEFFGKTENKVMPILAQLQVGLQWLVSSVTSCCCL